MLDIATNVLCSSKYCEYLSYETSAQPDLLFARGKRTTRLQFPSTRSRKLRQVGKNFIFLIFTSFFKCQSAAKKVCTAHFINVSSSCCVSITTGGGGWMAMVYFISLQVISHPRKGAKLHKLKLLQKFHNFVHLFIDPSNESRKFPADPASFYESYAENFLPN